jgi:hypothetical protein
MGLGVRMVVAVARRGAVAGLVGVVVWLLGAVRVMESCIASV